MSGVQGEGRKKKGTRVTETDKELIKRETGTDFPEAFEVSSLKLRVYNADEMDAWINAFNEWLTGKLSEIHRKLQEKLG